MPTTEPTITITAETADRALLALLETMSEARRSRRDAADRACMSYLPAPALAHFRQQLRYWDDQLSRDETAVREIRMLQMGLEPTARPPGDE